MLTLKGLKNKFSKSVCNKYFNLAYGVNKKYNDVDIIENKMNIIAYSLFSDNENISKLEGIEDSAITVNNNFIFNSNGTGDSSSYRHVQSIASDTWIVNHNLGFMPSLPLITNLLNQNIDASVQNVNINQTIITFSLPKSGYAYFS